MGVRFSAAHRGEACSECLMDWNRKWLLLYFARRCWKVTETLEAFRKPSRRRCSASRRGDLGGEALFCFRGNVRLRLRNHCCGGFLRSETVAFGARPRRGKGARR